MKDGMNEEMTRQDSDNASFWRMQQAAFIRPCCHSFINDKEVYMNRSELAAAKSQLYSLALLSSVELKSVPLSFTELR